MAEADSNGQISKAYGFNPQAPWSTNPLWQAEVQSGSLSNAQFHYLHTDHLGTPVLATDKVGNTSWKARAESFGKVVSESGTLQQNLRFPGQYHDRETGTHYNFHRDYNPNTGRYLQSDPIGLNGGENVYAYGRQNPMRGVDSMGLSTLEWGVTDEAPKGNVNTIYCKNGVPELYIIEITWAKDCPAIEKCIRAHEDTHRQDALKYNPNICKGVVGIRGIFYNDRSVSDYTTSELLRDAEMRALNNERECLIKEFDNGKYGTRCGDEQCARLILDMLVWVEILKSRVKNGTYWKDTQ
jgi:RHS repeat-associated protein